ncbi:MAG TPA: DUF4070 domain-containing protein [bacterium]|mgnify:CR=1 FL=1|nr:DUF4070 domain-containing protein [bacterium]
MRVLLVYPETPHTFWSFRSALKFISKKSSEPPLGLLTVAALLPGEWQKRLIDMNVTSLKDGDLRWADWVFISGMNIHKESFQNVVRRCNKLGVKAVGGGPMCTTEPDHFMGLDHMVLGEAEEILPELIRDIQEGSARRIYAARGFPNINRSPVPLYDLLERKKYASMSIQYSRGCPFHCEFCSVTLLNGHKPRTKSASRFIRELESLYDLGWRGSVNIVDDNFIGNKRRIKTELLPALIDWSEKHGYPFQFSTEVSINLADDEALIKDLVKAGMTTVFVGIETINESSLKECRKGQNLNRDLVNSVRMLQNHGLIVHGGFIIGFDQDPDTIFEDQIHFIQKTGIATAMVGLLTALSGTSLFHRLKSEKRLLELASGNNMDGSLNFIPKMNYQRLMAGYHSVLNTLYSPAVYCERVKTFLREYRVPKIQMASVTLTDIRAFFRSLWKLGVLEKGRRSFWNLLFFTLRRYPRKFALAVTLAIYGFHFRQVIKTI